MAERRSRGAFELVLPYGRRTIRCRIPRAHLGEILHPNPIRARHCEERARVREALENPIGEPTLEAAVRSDDSVAIIVDDLTRPTPVHLIVPELLKRLRASGVPDERVKIILALGTHRAMSEREIRRKVGAAVASRLKVENHDFRNAATLVDAGRSDEGYPILINRSVMEATFRIGVGNIVPHCVAGWSGGGKIIYPGVAGEHTVDGFHGSFGTDLQNRIGNIEAPIRKEIERLVEHVGLNYVVNTVLTATGTLYKAVAGHSVQAHRAGVEYAREVYAVKHRTLADVVIVSSYPADIDFWQAGKAVYAGELVLRDAGTLILVTPCPERIAHNHDVLRYMAMPFDELRTRLKSFQVEDRSAAAVALRIGLVRKRVRVVVVSDGLTKTDVEGLGFLRAVNLQGAVDESITTHGTGCRVSVLTHGGDLYPERA